jgi:hypothetical protein
MHLKQTKWHESYSWQESLVRVEQPLTAYFTTGKLYGTEK